MVISSSLATWLAVVVNGAFHKWRKPDFRDFESLPPRQYQIHATFLPLVSTWLIPPPITDIIFERSLKQDAGILLQSSNCVPYETCSTLRTNELHLFADRQSRIQCNRSEVSWVYPTSSEVPAVRATGCSGSYRRYRWQQGRHRCYYKGIQRHNIFGQRCVRGVPF